jgi:hypothetical protein
MKKTLSQVFGLRISTSLVPQIAVHGFPVGLEKITDQSLAAGIIIRSYFLYRSPAGGSEGPLCSADTRIFVGLHSNHSEISDLAMPQVHKTAFTYPTVNLLPVKDALACGRSMATVNSTAKIPFLQATSKAGPMFFFEIPAI